MSEAYYFQAAPGTRFPPEALDEWRKFLDAQPELTVRREDGAYWWFADAAAANGFRHSNYPVTEYADLIAFEDDVIEFDASYVHEDPTLSAFGAFLTRFNERWPYSISGTGAADMTVEAFLHEYRVVRGP